MEQSVEPSLDDLRAFVQIAQNSSFSKAAVALGVPKATLSRRLAQLERDLGVALLLRTTRSVQVTDAGRAFLPEAAAVLAALDDATGRLRGVGRAPHGRLRLATDETFGGTVLSPLLAEFAVTHPAIDLEVELTRRTVDLAYEGFDFAVRVGALTDTSQSARRLGALRQGLYASPAYLEHADRPRYAHELAEHPALQCVGADSAPRWILTDGAQTLEVPIRPRLRANDHRVLCDAAVAGLGVALCAEAVAASAVAAGRLERLLPEWGAPEIVVHAVFPSQRVLAPKVSTCVEFLVARLARDAVTPERT